MRVFIIGTGAMGCLFGALLCPHAEVTLFNPRQEAVTAIQREGIRVEQLDGSQKVFRPEAVSAVEDYVGKADLVIIFTKAHATRAAAITASRVIGSDASILTLQNGLGNKEQIDTILNCSITIAGITSQAATSVGPGISRHCGVGETLVGGQPEQAEQLNKIQKLFVSSGILTRIHGDTESLIWGKLIINVGINALTALLQVPNGVLAEVPACTKLMQMAVEEALAVAESLGIKLPYEEPMEEVLHVCRHTAANRASMLQDRIRQAQTEIDVINGAIVRKAKECNISVPVNQCITDLIHAMEATYHLRV